LIRPRSKTFRALSGFGGSNRTRSSTGISPQLIDDTLNDAYGQRQITQYFTQLNTYPIILEITPALQRTLASLDRIYLKSPLTGAAVSLSALVSVDTTKVGPLSVTHQGQFPAVTLSFNLRPGVALGQAVDAINRAAQEIGMTNSIIGTFQGNAQAFQASLASTPILIIGALVVVYMILAILYESFIHPLTILSTLPSAGIGALLALRAGHMDLSVIGIIGIILLIGIVKKNGIMLVDFAIVAQRDRHLLPLEAIREACLLRFRPILMTTAAAFLAGVPLAFGTGTGSELQADTGKHVWAERYDRDLADVFALQDEITEAATIAIAPAIADAERQRAMRKPPGSLDAWAAYQRGLWHVGKFTADDNVAAQRFFQQAIDLDPNFAGGYSGLAWAQRHAAAAQRRDMPENLTSAEALARRAVALDGNDAEARTRLGQALMVRGDYQGALAEIERALAISPNLASAHGVHGAVLMWSGHPKEGRVALENSIRLDPRHPGLGLHLHNVAISYYLTGEYDAALEAARRAISAYPDLPNTYLWFTAALGQAGRIEEAKGALEKAIAIAPASFDMFARRRAHWHLPEDHAHMLEGLLALVQERIPKRFGLIRSATSRCCAQ